MKHFRRVDGHIHRCTSPQRSRPHCGGPSHAECKHTVSYGCWSKRADQPIPVQYILSDVRKFPSTAIRTVSMPLCGRLPTERLTRSLLLQEFVRFVIGDGLVSASAHDHARQRRIMAPAFTQAHIKQMTPIFTEKAEELSNKMTEIINKGGQPRWCTDGQKDVLNVTELLDCASFDIVGKAGFGVEFEVRCREAKYWLVANAAATLYAVSEEGPRERRTRQGLQRAAPGIGQV